MSQRGSSNGKNGAPSGPRTLSIAISKAGPSKPAKKGSIFSSSSKKAVLDSDDDEEEEGALANLATKKPNLLDPPSEPKAALTSIKRPDTLPKKPEVHQAPEPPSLLSRISWEDSPITPAPATFRASKAGLSRDPASASAPTSEQTQYYKPSRAEAAALARTKEASSGFSSTASTALKDDYAPSRPVQPLEAPKMAISLGKGLAKSAGLPPKPNAFKEAARSSASLSSSSSKHASTSRSGQPSNSLSSSRGSGTSVASKRNVFGDHEREASPPPDRAAISSSKGKERATDLEKPAESDLKQKRKSRWSENEARPLVNGSGPTGDSQSIASTSALPAEPLRIPTPPPIEPEPEPSPKTPPKPRKLKNSKWATPEPEVGEPSKPVSADESKKDKTIEKNRSREPGTPPPPARAVSETDVQPSRQDVGKPKSREPGTPPRPSISIPLSATTATTTKHISKTESIQPDRARSRTSSRPRMDDEARTPPPRPRRHDEPGTPPRQRIKNEPGTPPRPPRLQEPGTPPRSNLSPDASLSRASILVASPRRRAASISRPSPPLPPTQRQTTPPPPAPPSVSRPATPPPPPPPDIVVTEKPQEILRPPPISLKKPLTPDKAQPQQPPSPFLSTDFIAEIERPPSPTLTEKEEEREKSFFVVYNPALEAKPVAQSSEPIIRYEGFNHPRHVEDPRQKNDKADWNALLRTSRSSRPLKVVQHIKEKHYSYDKNSTCPPPPLIPTAILVSGLAYFATAEKLRSHFSAYGIISDIDLKTDPKTAGLLGICWIKYVDQVERKLYGKEGSYIRKATGVQDGNLTAQEAIKRNHNQKVPTLARPIDKISVVMDGEKVLTEQKYKKILDDRKALEDQKYGRKPILAAAADITKSEPSSSATPIPGRSTPDDPVRQRTISSTSSIHAPKSAQQPSSLTPSLSLHNSPPIPNKPSTQGTSAAARTLSIPIPLKPPTAPRAQQPKNFNAFENVPTGPKALMSPTAPPQNRPNVQRTPTDVKFPPSGGRLPQSAGAPSGQRGPLKLPTNKTPDKSGNQEQSSSSSSEDSDNEHEDDDRRKREDDDKIFFPRSARAGQDIVKGTVEALSPMKESTPGTTSASAIQDLRAKITAYKRLEDSKLPFVKVARSSFPNFSTLQAWMQGSHPLKIFGDSLAFYVTFRNRDAAASAVEVLKTSPFQGKLVEMTAQDALSWDDVQILETDLRNMTKAQSAHRASRAPDHWSPRRESSEQESRRGDHWSPRRESRNESDYIKQQRFTEIEILKGAMQTIGIDLQAAFLEDLQNIVVPGRASAAWEKHSSTHLRQAIGSASPAKAQQPALTLSPGKQGLSTSLALQAATQDQSSTTSLAPGILPSFTRKKVASITARPMQAKDARYQLEQRDLSAARGVRDSYRPAPSAPSARERSASTANDHSTSPQRKSHSQLPPSQETQARRADPAPIPPSARQEESVKPVKKAEQKPKRAQPKITFTSSEESEDEKAAAQLVKKREAERKRQRSQKKDAKRRKSVSKVISSPLSAPEDEEQEEDEDDEPEHLAILPTPPRQKVAVKEISPPAADYDSSDLSDLTDLSDLEDVVPVPPSTPLTAQVEPALEPTSKRALDEVEPEPEQAVQKVSKKPRLASPEPTPLLEDPLFGDVEGQVEFVLPLEIRERSRSSDKVATVATPAIEDLETQEEVPEEEEEEEEEVVVSAKNNRKKGKAGRRKAAPKSKKKKKATPAASTRSRTTSRAFSATPDIQALGLAEDDEDSYYLRLQMERVRSGKTFFPDEIPEEPEAPEGYQRPTPRHDTGCARAEGYYRVPQAEKLSYLAARNQAQVDTTQGGTSSIAISRLARVNARHLVSGLDKTKKATASDADVLQFNQLRTRKKQLRFARSPIHDWGLYAQEFIPAGEMVIEYVGEQIRQQVADKREKQYERQGIGSSYLFRVDDDVVIDATMKGNLGRLINHCCTPNCNARILSVGSSKKIVIYAKQPIYEGDEITYDYHFPLEDEKIPCLCGMSGCRGFLN